MWLRVSLFGMMKRVMVWKIPERLETSIADETCCYEFAQGKRRIVVQLAMLPVHIVYGDERG